MQPISLLTQNFEIKTPTEEFKNFRDELIKKAVIHINELRKGTPYENKVETPAKLAIRINKNIFLKNDTELSNLLKECREKNNYSKLYWIIK